MSWHLGAVVVFEANHKSAKVDPEIEVFLSVPRRPGVLVVKDQFREKRGVESRGYEGGPNDQA